MHIRTDDIRSGIPSSHLFSTHDRTTSVVVISSSPLECTHDKRILGVTCYYHPWTHTRSDNLERGFPACPLSSRHGRMKSVVECNYCHWEAHRLQDIKHDMPSFHLDCRQGRITLDVACHRIPRRENTVGLHLALHDIMALCLDTLSDDIGCGRPSLPVDNIHSVGEHRTWHAIISGFIGR